MYVCVSANILTFFAHGKSLSTKNLIMDKHQTLAVTPVESSTELLVLTLPFLPPFRTPRTSLWHCCLVARSNVGGFLFARELLRSSILLYSAWIDFIQYRSVTSSWLYEFYTSHLTPAQKSVEDAVENRGISQTILKTFAQGKSLSLIYSSRIMQKIDASLAGEHWGWPFPFCPLSLFGSPRSLTLTALPRVRTDVIIFAQKIKHEIRTCLLGCYLWRVEFRLDKLYDSHCHLPWSLSISFF